MWGNMMLTLVFLLLSKFSECTGRSISPPGKPVHLNCRSSEKETFTCWWEPGSDGGLSTAHHLYYQREDSDGTFECPDYQSAGSNSCFFDRSHTSIWVSYNITVVASNMLGTSRSDPLEVDVMYIVQPNSPENVRVSVEETNGSQHLLVKWEPPHDADTSSGWITLTYQLRVKRQIEKEWEEYFSGKQTQYIIYSPHPGEVYMVQVRCDLDHGFWSEWSPTIYSEVPDYSLKERSIWIVVAVLLAFVLLVMMCILSTKRKYVKHCLPPVPGPKITGFDIQFFKNGGSEDILGALVNQGLSPMLACNDHTMAYLLVFDTDDSTLDFQKPQTRTKNTLPTANKDYRETANSKSNCDAELRVDPTTMFSPCPSAVTGLSPSMVTGPCPSMATGLSPSMVTGVSPSTVTGYVDVQRHKVDEQVPADKRQGDYSKISGVDRDNILLLQKGIVPPSIISCEKWNQADCTNLKPCKPDMTDSTQEGMHTGLTGNGLCGNELNAAYTVIDPFNRSH